MFLFLFKHLNLPSDIYYISLVTEYCLDFFNEIISILDIVFFFYLVNLFLHVNFCYVPFKLG